LARRRRRRAHALASPPLLAAKSPGSHRLGTSFDEASDRVGQNGRTSRQPLAQVNAATRLDRFPPFAVSLHSSSRPPRASVGVTPEINSMSILCDDRHRVHHELVGRSLFCAVLTQNISCCFAHYVQCCRNIFSVIAKD
jgi:hypothetical protein